MHTLDLAKHPALRGYLRAAEGGDLVLISEGALVIGYIAVPGVQLGPCDHAMLRAALDAAPAKPSNAPEPAAQQGAEASHADARIETITTSY